MHTNLLDLGLFLTGFIGSWIAHLIYTAFFDRRD